MASKETNILTVTASKKNKGKQVIVSPDPFLKTYKRISIDGGLETRSILKRIKRAFEKTNDISFAKAGSGSQTRPNKWVLLVGMYVAWGIHVHFGLWECWSNNIFPRYYSSWRLDLLQTKFQQWKIHKASLVDLKFQDVGSEMDNVILVCWCRYVHFIFFFVSCRLLC